MRSYSSWIAGLSYRGPDGTNRARYCARYLQPGALLDLAPEPDNQYSEDGYAVALKHRDHHLGYIPARHAWVGRALSEGSLISCTIVAIQFVGWIFRRARSVQLRIAVGDPAARRPAMIEVARSRPMMLDDSADAVRRNRERRAREACIDGLRILTRLALSDDMHSEEELNIEASYIESRLAMTGFDHDPHLVDAMMVIARGLTVGPRTFARVVNSVAVERNHFLLVWDAAERLSAVAKRVTKIEADAMIRLVEAGRTKGWLVDSS